jgi:murein DD-endopeptidase MepM/ murein hydrolase activator NlpD
MFPVPGYKINSRVWWRRIFGKRGYHKGVDVAAPAGTKILCIGKGEVEDVWPNPNGWYSGYGNYAVIKLANWNRVLYGHMKDRSKLEVGKPIKKWDEIGLVGTTWLSTGNHLHLEVRKLDPDQKNEKGAAFFTAPVIDPEDMKMVA